MNQRTVECHFNVYMVANKYLLSQLAGLALEAIRKEVKTIDAITKSTKDPCAILDIMKLLLRLTDRNDDLWKLVRELCDKHLIDLMGTPQFRALINGEDGKLFLGLVLDEIKRGQELNWMRRTSRNMFSKCSCKRSFGLLEKECERCVEKKIRL